ncbi:hypothetical protein BH10PSE2_BH10PSE2_03440 [soil metagenome]
MLDHLTENAARHSTDTSFADDATDEQVAGAIEPLTLLLVEDDPDTAADLTIGLIEAGHRVVGPFQDAAAAQAAVALHQIDLALLDINLSGETDGVALATALKSRWGVPTIFLSGDVGAASRHADIALGTVLKPYTFADVQEAIARSGV